MRHHTSIVHLALLAVAACNSSPRHGSVPTISNQAGVNADRGIALAVVFNGWELFAGNDTLTDADDPSRYPGVLPGLDAEIAKLTALPGGASVAALIVYDDRATVSRKLGPLRQLSSGWFGTQRDYFGKIGVELIAGIELAAKTLEEASPNLDRVILVLGDGCDTHQDMATQQLARLRLPERNIALHQIQVETRLSAECAPLVGSTVHGTSMSAGIDHFVAALAVAVGKS